MIEQGYYFGTHIDRARLIPLNLYRYLAMVDAVIQAFYSKTCRIAVEALVR